MPPDDPSVAAAGAFIQHWISFLLPLMLAWVAIWSAPRFITKMMRSVFDMDDKPSSGRSTTEHREWMGLPYKWLYPSVEATNEVGLFHRKAEDLWHVVGYDGAPVCGCMIGPLAASEGSLRERGLTVLLDSDQAMNALVMCEEYQGVGFCQQCLKLFFAVKSEKARSK